MERKLTQKKKGQSLVEYIALTALIAIVSITAVRALGGVVKTKMGSIKGQVSGILKVGSSQDTPDDGDEGNDQPVKNRRF